MNYNTVYVGMDVHKESFTLCCMTLEMEKAKYTMKTEADYKNILVYLDTMRGEFYGEDTHFVCGYEAGCPVIRFIISLQQPMLNVSFWLRQLWRLKEAKAKSVLKLINVMLKTSQNVLHTAYTVRFTSQQMKNSKSKSMFV